MFALKKKTAFPLKPHKWTHYHTLRLFHLSLSACLLFAFLAASIGQISLFSEARAGEVIASQNISIMASVGQIQTGPGVITESGGVNNNPALVPTISPPLLSITPALRAGIRPEMIVSKKPLDPNFTERDFVDVVNTQYPEFFGHTNINNAVIFLELDSGVLLRVAVYADQKGDWAWKSTEPLRPGKNSLVVIAKSLEADVIQARLVYNFLIELSNNVPSQICTVPSEASGIASLFDVLVKVPSQFKTIAPGDDLVATIKLINFSPDKNRHDVLIVYDIEDELGQQILQSSETVAVDTQISITKTFRLLQSVPSGKYRLIVRVPSQNTIATSGDEFEVKGSPILALGTHGRVDVTLVFQTLGFLLFFFAIIGYFEYNKVTILSDRIRRISEDDFKFFYK